MTFSDADIHRYARHILLPQIGAKGQNTLSSSRVLVIGAGGLGSPVLLYLAAAGVGTIGVVDHDVVDLSNIQRQIIHTTQRIGMNKTDSTAESLSRLNSQTTVETFPFRLEPGNAPALFSNYDIIADCSDNFSTRFLINDTAFSLGKPVVSAAAIRFEGHLTVFDPRIETAPCYRCLLRDEPPSPTTTSCAEYGILGPVTGVLGSLQAAEILKSLLDIGERLVGRLIIYDALNANLRTLTVARDPACPLCVQRPCSATDQAVPKG